jgi:hypothetical protein
MFYGVDVNHARLFPLGNTLADTWATHSAPCPCTVSTGTNNYRPGFRRPLSPLLHHALRWHRTGSRKSLQGSGAPGSARPLVRTCHDVGTRRRGPCADTVCRSRMTVRSATLLRAASSAIRLVHQQDFREWITRPFRSRLRFVVSCSVGPAQRDHLRQPVRGG